MGGRDYRVVIVGTVHGADQAGLDHHFDQVMEEFLRLEVTDPSVDVEFSTGTVRMAVSVEAQNPLEATEVASSFIRTAIHAVGGGTPDWPSPDDPTWVVELTGIETGQLVNN